MKLFQILLLTIVISIGVSSCSKKKETLDIIAQKPQEEVPGAPEMMQESTYTEKIQWQDKEYNVTIKRQATEDLPLIEDGGKQYFDNKINVHITREDGSVFFDRTFLKSDFSSYVNEGYMKRSALLGFVLEEVEPQNLKFAASVGLPDILSDEYIPLLINISSSGKVTIGKDKRPDMDFSLEEDEGV